MTSDQDPFQSINGWTENKKLVLHRLEEIEHHVRSMEKRISKIEKDIAVQNTQTRIFAGIIGAVAGLVPALLSILMAGRM